MIYKDLLEDFIEIAIKEDIGDGDHTSLSCIPEDHIGKVKLVVKQSGIVAGVDIAHDILKRFDPNISFDKKINDGETIAPGDVVFIASGKSLALLQAERLLLNIIQRMSGIATQTQEYVQLLKGTKTTILDTRKTTPGMRYLDKMAVKLGGGDNHRYGLFDMILLKDNHIDFAGGNKAAIERVKSYLAAKNKDLKIEVEARNMKDVKEIMAIGGVHRIMLDNFSIDETIAAVKLIDGKYETESSGGITKETIRSYAECGVDFISVGALTHQIKSLDLSLLAITD